MAENSKIEWTDHTWNGWRGCTKVSPGCANCYAESLSIRTGHPAYKKGIPRERLSEANWKKPLKWNSEAAKNLLCADCAGDRWNEATGGSLSGSCMKCGEERHLHELKPIRPKVFCSSLSDWLDAEVPIEWLADLLKLIHDTPNLDWLLLTKRPENFQERFYQAHNLLASQAAKGGRPEYPNWVANWVLRSNAPSNIWIGTTVENQEYADQRIPELLKIPARIRFLSCEPLLGPVDLWPSAFKPCPNARDGLITDPTTGQQECCRKCDFTGVGDEAAIDWVICGGESGHGKNIRPMHPDWARALRDQCASAGVPFFFKQWGEFYPSMQAEAEAALVSGKGSLLRHDGALFDENEGVTFCCNNCKVDEVLRVGKKTAGRLLDGKEYSEFPK